MSITEPEGAAATAPGNALENALHAASRISADVRFMVFSIVRDWAFCERRDDHRAQRRAPSVESLKMPGSRA
jgi:hypothetical protein